ncbi:MAG: hypothetical protein NTY98_00860 [Verrucomicrobia bacterium]|nr:hypothetical protein [Verrucomicrobiota bacterium]
MKFLTRCACLLVVFSLSGCYPEERIWWSPKGDRAIVAVNEQLHLVTKEGGLGEPLLGGAPIKDWLFKTLDWLPDGTGFVCSRRRHVRTWAEAQKLIPAKESERIEAWLPMVLPTLEFQIARVKDPGNLTGLQALIPGHDKEVFDAGLRVLYERQRADVEKAFRKLPQGEEILGQLADPQGNFSVIELCIVRLGPSTNESPVGIAWGMLDPVFMPKVSPKHDAIAFLQLHENSDAPDLIVMSLDGKTSLVIAQQISSAGFQWMRDGRTLVFTNSLGQSGDSLHSIQQITVLQESGALMRPAYDKMPDGSVGSRPKLEPLLHLIAADGQSLSTIPTVPGDLPMDLGYMVVSPDGKRVAVVEEATDAVAVVEIGTGKTEIIAEPHPNWNCETVPAWKSATELTFAALDDKTHAPCWMLWSAAGGKHSLSTKWPVAATQDWLKERKSSTATKANP